jgi:hypothetical protein
MKHHGAYKIRYQRAAGGVYADRVQTASDDRIESLVGRVTGAERRMQRIVDSLRDEILDSAEGSTLRIRRIFSTPREIFRVEIERPDLGYQRTTILGREALEALLEVDDVRSAVETFAQSA